MHGERGTAAGLRLQRLGSGAYGLARGGCERRVLWPTAVGAAATIAVAAAATTTTASQTAFAITAASTALPPDPSAREPVPPKLPAVPQLHRLPERELEKRRQLGTLPALR